MKKRRIIEIEGILTALEPIHQGGNRSGGTISSFHRQLMRVEDGFEEMPVVTGNSFAGILRDMCAFWCLDQIEYEQFTGKDALKAFDVLTSGGGRVVKADSRKYIDLFTENELKENFPVLSLFGGSIGNRMLQGRFSVSNLVPVCNETKYALPDQLWEHAAQWHIDEMLSVAEFSTRDDKKNRLWQDRIDPNTLGNWLIEQEELDRKNEAKNKPISMRYGMEVLAPGTEFYVSMKLTNPTDVDMGALWGALMYFNENPKIGGRANRGLGAVRLDLKQYQLKGLSRVEDDTAMENVALAVQHLQERRASIVKMLEEGL